MRLGVNELCPISPQHVGNVLLIVIMGNFSLSCFPLHGHASWTLQLPCLHNNLILHKRCNESPETTAKSTRCNGKVLCMELYHMLTVY